VVDAGYLVGGRYRLERLLGRGASADVWRAADTTSGRAVALKLLRASWDPAPRLRLEREARLTRGIQHPALVTIEEIVEEPSGQLALVMELIEGEGLDKVLAREGRLDAAAAARILAPVASALATAHALGVIHRDVKPANILVRDGAGVLVDLGIAKHIDPLHGDRLTKTGSALGTPAYMAPEQLLADPDIDHRVDVWAVGLVLYECLTGARAARGDSIAEVVRRVLFEPIEPVSQSRPDVEPALVSLVSSLLQRDVRRRAGDLRAVVELLGKVGGLELAPAPEPRRVAQAASRGAATLGLETQSDEAVDVEAAPVSAAAPSGPISRLSSTESRVAVAVTLAIDSRSLQEGALAWMLSSCRRFGVPQALGDDVMGVIVTRGSTLAELGRLAVRCAEELVEAGWARAADVGVVRVVRDGEDTISAWLSDSRAELARPDSVRGRVRIDPEIARVLAAARRARASGAARPSQEEVFVGREHELAQLLSIADECVEESVARAALVLGEPGVGKSALRAELGRRLLSRSLRTHAAGAEMFESETAFAFAGRIARALTGLDDRAAGALDDGRLAAFVAELRLPPGIASDWSAFVRAPERWIVPGVPLHSQGDSMRRAFEHVLRAMTRDRPAVLLLDDLHWADGTSLELLERVTKSLAESPFYLAMFARPELDTARAGWMPAAMRRPLGGLSRRSAERLATELLGTGSGAAEIAARAGQNPLFIAQLSRAHAEGIGDGLPDTVLAVVQARLEGTTPLARRALRAASVLGATFDEGGVRAVLGEGASPTAQLRELEAADFIEPIEGRAGASAYRFRHALIAEGAYSSLSPDDLARAHRKAAVHLAAQRDADPGVLARHAELGGLVDEGVAYRLDAAERSLAADDAAGAVAHAERGLASARSDAARGALASVCAQGLRLRGRPREALELARRALAWLEPSVRWLCAVEELGVAAMFANEHAVYDESRALLLMANPATDAERAAHASACAALASSYIQIGMVSPSDELAALAERSMSWVAHELPAVAGRLAQRRAFAAHLRGDLEESLREHVACVGLSERAPFSRRHCQDTINLGFCCAELGLAEEAERHLRAALEVATALGLQLLIGSALHNLGLAVARAGRTAEGLGILDQYLASPSLGTYYELWARTYKAEVLWSLGSFVEGREEAKRALSNADPDARGLGQARAIAALCALALGERADGLADAGLAARELEESGAVIDGEATIRLAWARALEASADPRALEVRALAQRRLQERAARIRDEATRCAFLALPVHRATLG
jgi:tetratricopeptide (TPR) repeat protein